MQYAQLKFGWTSIQLGNFISLMGATRIVALCVAIPLLIKIIRKPHKEPERDPHPGVPPSTSSSSSLINNDHEENVDGASSSASPTAIGKPQRTGRGNDVNASGFSKIEDDEWDAHKQQHRLIHDYSKSITHPSHSDLHIVD